LDYAANAVVYWPADSLREQFEAQETADGYDADAVIAELLGPEGDPEEFWERVRTNLHAQRIRMIFVADVIPRELRRIVEFLNEEMDPAEVLVVEIRQYVGDGLKTLVPRVIGVTADAEQRKGRSRRVSAWTADEFDADLRTRVDAGAVALARKIRTWATEKGLVLTWGRGSKLGTSCRRWGQRVTGFAVVVVVTAACVGDADAPEDVAATASAVRFGEVTFDVGVTEDACPDAVNPDHGCIYLGSISDLSGPQAATGKRITQAQAAFWKRVNTTGGVRGFDIDVSRFAVDNANSPRTHRQRYEQVRGEVLALAQTFGTATTMGIRDDLVADAMVAVPTTRPSQWLFDDVILESGDTICVEAMNAVDYMASPESANAMPRGGGDIESVVVIHLSDDEGNDAAGGARVAAERNGMDFLDVETRRGADHQTRAVSAVLAEDPDLVIVATTPTETAAIVGQAAAKGFDHTIITTSQGWDDTLLDGPDAAVVTSLLAGARPYRAFTHGTAGYATMREALGDVEPDDAYTSGWVSSYPLYDALQAAADAGDLTRQGLLTAVDSLKTVDYEFMLPVGAGTLGADTPAGQAFTKTVFRIPDDPGEGPVRIFEEDYFAGVTAATYDFERPCSEDR